MPLPAWREAFSIMWTDTDDAGKDAVEEAIRAGKSDCANYWCVGPTNYSNGPVRSC
jgi:hypothetical protein